MGSIVLVGSEQAGPDQLDCISTFPRGEGNCNTLHQSWLRNPNANHLLWREMVSVLSGFVKRNVNCLDTLEGKGERKEISEFFLSL